MIQKLSSAGGTHALTPIQHTRLEGPERIILVDVQAELHYRRYPPDHNMRVFSVLLIQHDTLCNTKEEHSCCLECCQSDDPWTMQKENSNSNQSHNHRSPEKLSVGSSSRGSQHWFRGECNSAVPVVTQQKHR